MTPAHWKTRMHTTPRLIALAVLAASGMAQAQEITLKLGAIQYTTHEKTTGVTGIGIPPGADASIGDATTLLFTAEYALSPNIGVELVLGVPPKIKATATGSVAFLGEVLTARNVAPTVLFNYHFGAPGSALRPYVGIGVNYTKFTGISTPYGWDVHMTDSNGLAGQVGVDYAFSKQLGLFASVGVADVRSKLTATGATVLQTTIDFKPVTYSFGASYRF
jgi:outer membrane protein